MGITVERLRALLGFEELRLNQTESLPAIADGFAMERLRFRLPDGSSIRGILTRPKGSAVRRPAILHCHAHGGRYDIGASELVDGRPALLDPPGPALARRGFVVLSIDMPTFGERAVVTEDAAAKAALWHGRTLFGQMLSEQAAAVSWLAERRDVNLRRIAVTGLSMGATLAYFLAAIDPRIAAAAHLCCYADFAALVDSGAHDLHGHYLTIPGLLRETSTGEVAGLVAPRPQLICVGEDDPLTPPDAVAAALQTTQALYAKAGAPTSLVFLSQPGVGHLETPAMRRALLTFLHNYL